MKLYKGQQEVGQLTLGAIPKIDTKDKFLAEVLSYAVSNPLPLRNGFQKGDVFVTTVKEIGTEDKDYPQALSEFLAGYDYILR